MENNKNLLFISTLLCVIPSLNLIVPLILWFTQKDKLEGEAKEYARNLLNFELTVFILMFVFGFVFMPIAGLVGFVNLVILILAMLNIYNNKNYKFPFLLNLIK